MAIIYDHSLLDFAQGCSLRVTWPVKLTIQPLLNSKQLCKPSDDLKEIITFSLFFVLLTNEVIFILAIYLLLEKTNKNINILLIYMWFIFAINDILFYFWVSI